MLNLGTWQWTASRSGCFTSRYQLVWRLGGPHSRYGPSGGDEKNPFPCRESTTSPHYTEGKWTK